MPGLDVAPEGELFVDGQRHEPEHALGHGHVEIRPLTGRGAPRQGGRNGQGGVKTTGTTCDCPAARVSGNVGAFAPSVSIVVAL